MTETTVPARRSGRWSIRRWAAFAVIVAAVISLGAIAGGGVAIAQLDDARDQVVNRLDPAINSALRLTNALINEETGVRGYALGGQVDFLQPYTDGRTDEKAATAALRTELGDRFATSTADLNAVLRAASAWQTGYAEPTIAAIAAGRTVTAASADHGKALFDALRVTLARQDHDLGTLQKRAHAELENSATELQWTAIAIAIALVIGTIALSMSLRRGVTGPLGDLSEQARIVAAGDFAHPVTVGGPAEIANLGADVDSMRERILTELSALREVHAALDTQAQDLSRSNTELEQFAYVASHDLQEPLRKVASFCELLEVRYHDQLDERAQQYIHFAVDGATRMQSLINDLLAFSRVGRIGSDHVLIEGDDLVAAALGNLANNIEETGATISVDPLPTVRGDVALLTAVLQNLFANAIKFRDPERPPEISLTVRADGDYWLFTCTDNGIGIEPEYADRIFIIFQRLHSKAAYPGTGIGLAMCRKIIDYHGGRVWLDTTDPAPAHGSRMCFTLPQVTPSEGAPDD